VNYMWDSMAKMMSGSWAAMMQIQQATMTAATSNMELATTSFSKALGQTTEPVMPEDKRFRGEAWTENPGAHYLKQMYQIAAQWMMDLADSWEPIDPGLHAQSTFWTRQYVDALSPSNFLFTNPVALEETIHSGGANLQRGGTNLLRDLQQRRVSQVPENAFRIGKDLAATPGQVIHRSPLIELIQYTPSTPTVHEIPILIVPPWINKYYVMDMRPENSMIKFLVDSGFTVFAISWKNPDQSILDYDWADYMEEGPIKAINIAKAVTGSEQVNIVGYCLGGIISQVTVAYLTALGDESVNTATFFAAHQDFRDAGDISVFISPTGATVLDVIMKMSGGYLDGRNMAATFNMLRSNDLLWNYVVNNYLLGKDPPAFDLLYWNSDGTRVPGKVHSFLIRDFFVANKLMKPNGITINDVGIDLGRITTPTYVVTADSDHIVPWKGAFIVRRLQSGPVRFILSGGGHIAGIINPPADKKRGYWVNDSGEEEPDAWLEGADKKEGSWWNDWIPWLAEQSGEGNEPPPMGNDEHPALMAAPGTYVLED
jgi:polyhydroxyalkanoate synthase